MSFNVPFVTKKSSSNEKTTILRPLSRVVQAKQPCPNCSSSDAYHIYDDGHGFCFSCNKPTFDNEVDTNSRTHKLPIINFMDDQFTYQYISHRGITKETMQFYGVQTKIDPTGKPVAVGFPYGDSATKVRQLDKKEFHSVGNMREAGLFGADKFSKGSARSITITEGEFDALSVYQMLGSAYPAVSVRSASSAKADCDKHRAYLNAFERIYLCFDNDEPGRKAKAEVARL